MNEKTPHDEHQDNGATASAPSGSLTDEGPTAEVKFPSSYSMLQPRIKRMYAKFYKELYNTPERRVLDPKVQELISIAASLIAKCEGCIDGHIKKAIAHGATKDEISETLCIAMAINAAAVVDFSDHSARRLRMNNFPPDVSDISDTSNTSNTDQK